VDHILCVHAIAQMVAVQTTGDRNFYYILVS